MTNFGISKRLVLIGGLMCLTLLTTWGQSNSPGGVLAADTSFNIRSEFLKQVKRYPHIEVATLGDTTALTIIRDVVYTNHGERKLHADIVFPKKTDCQSLPVIVFIHG